ncbi:general secretion pathway protein GspB [uncultured Shewanella sp.]|uniref:general secretion pathway protein GspB n=1 Tax=uncultured Shewanella sp. TaxID=173975 RepID=UPI002609C499|nr:general secretion pathway protein GspB [uncultured Shewanella sp.]
MSILLDAVTRSKQQEANIDPVLTPRLDFYSTQRKDNLTKKAIVFVIIIVSSSVLAWAVSRFMINGLAVESQSVDEGVTLTSKNEALSTSYASQKVVIEPSKAVNHQVINSQAVNNQAVNSQAQVASITFVGKSALPVPQAQPIAPIESRMTAQRLAKAETVTAIGPRYTERAVTDESLAGGSLPAPIEKKTLTVSAKRDVAKQEPMILGANSNQKGQDRLAALKKEVAIAASEVGLSDKSTQVHGAQSKRIPSSSVPSKSVEPTSAQTKVAALLAANTEQAPTSEENALLIATLQKELRQVEREHAQAADVQLSASTSTEPSAQASSKPPAYTFAESSTQVPKYGQLPTAVQLQVPEFNINGHVYSSNVDKRWLNVDGVELQQGDLIQGKLKIIEIRPQDVVLEISGNKFSVPAA